MIMKMPHKKFLQESLQILCLIKVFLSNNTSIVSLQSTKLLLNGMRASLYRNRGRRGALGEGRVSLSKVRHLSKMELKRGDTSLELGATSPHHLATTQDMASPLNTTMSQLMREGCHM